MTHIRPESAGEQLHRQTVSVNVTASLPTSVTTVIVHNHSEMLAEIRESQRDEDLIYDEL